MNALVIPLGVLANLILYLCFGSMVTIKRNGKTSMLFKIAVGFFFYYFVFFFFCVPPMQYFRPLSMLTRIWTPVVAVIVIVSIIINGRQWIGSLREGLGFVKKHKIMTAMIIILIAVQVVLVSSTYNFTLDAAYYVANVSTSVETNMMNVYDPFTGAWQDHYEMRYFFATYSIQDAVVCQLTGIPALIWTKTIMAATIIILTNIVYYLIARELFDRNEAVPVGRRSMAIVIMMAFMLGVNVTFNTIYTSSLFLMTRTYEGKAIVGNLALMLIFYIFLRMNDDCRGAYYWLLVFVTGFGAATISSSANMLIPVELTVLFVPLIFRKKHYIDFVKYIVCVIPGIVFTLSYVLYVKGYFVLYTYPTK